MRALREMGGGLIIAVLSLLLVIGGISLSLAENTPDEQPTPTPLPPSVSTSIELPTFTPIVLTTNTPETLTPTVTATITLVPTQMVSIVCNPPVGWIQILVSTNDTLYTIAERYKTTAEILNVSNCLNNTIPATGSRLYVPPIPTVTIIPCGPYAGWIKAYTVRPGDNLYRISLLYRTTVQQLQRANCMGASVTIYAGQVLWVPNVPTSTPGITNVPNTSTMTQQPQPATSTPEPPTATTSPTNTTIPDTATPSLTSFPSPTPTTPVP
jgi:LysM repeat protein